MKTFKLFTGTAAFLAIGALAACSSDEPVGNKPGVAEADETRYMSIQICAPADKSRAFENGATNESHVTSLDFIFYDAAGNPTAQRQHISGTDLKDTDFSDQPDKGNVSKIWTSVVPVELVQGDNLPSMVVCIVNGNGSAVQELSTKPYSNLRELVRPGFVSGQDFLMCNSVYFGTNDLGQDNQRLCGTYINSEKQLYATEAEAREAINAASQDDADKSALVNIYVERLAAKVGLTMQNAPAAITLKNGEGEGTVELQFVPEYWFVNATSKDNFLTKRYGIDVNGNINYSPSFDEIDKAINGSGTRWEWNDKNNRRSYWGCSTSYYEHNYPMVSDEVFDPEGVDKRSEYAQKYYSYNEVKVQAGMNDIEQQAIAATGGKFEASTTQAGNTVTSTGFIYTRETTTAISSIRDVAKNPAATVASAVIVGGYTVDGVAVRDGESFWIDRNAGGNGTYYGSENAAISLLADRQRVVFIDDLGNGYLRNGFFLKHPKAEVRALLTNPNLAGRLVTIQLETVPENAFFFDSEVGGIVAVTEANLAKVNAQLVTAGYLDQFYNGHGFYSTPIRHLRFDNAHYTKDGGYDWENLNVGELGVVRNHVYNLTITGITGLATGMRSDDQPIVPPVTTTDQYIAMRLNILAWNIANTWSIEL